MRYGNVTQGRRAGPGKEVKMKLIDRIIFGFLAVCLGILAAKAIMPMPVWATTEEIVDVNLIEIGGRAVIRDWLINK